MEIKCAFCLSIVSEQKNATIGLCINKPKRSTDLYCLCGACATQLKQLEGEQQKAAYDLIEHNFTLEGVLLEPNNFSTGDTDNAG